MTRILCLITLIFVLIGFALQSAYSQAVTAPLSKAPNPNALQQNRSLNTYNEKLNRMAEILGALHYLYNLCTLEPMAGSQNANLLWRNYMQELLDALHKNTIQKTRLYVAFNRSYSAFADNYSSCTQAAKEALARYQREGQNLSHFIQENFGQ